MRAATLSGGRIGALNLSRATEGTADAADVVAAQAFADGATITIIDGTLSPTDLDVVPPLAPARSPRPLGP